MEKGTINLSTANAVGAILNKKMGVTTGFSPSEWADTVNLMGKLPEKTVSGGIVRFDDGADGVPLKSLVANIAPTLEGVSSVEVVTTGRNLLDFSAFSDYSNWKADITENQSFPTTVSNRGLLLDLPQGTYTVSFGIDAETYPQYLYLCKDDGNSSTRLIYFTGGIFSVASGTFTVDGISKYYFRLGTTGSEANFNSQIAKIAWGQIEVGSTETEYEPYVAPTTHTASLGRAVYGGSADIITGEGKSLYEKYIVTGQETGDFLAGTNNNGNRIGLSGFVLAQKPLYAGGISNIGENKACLNSATWTIGSWCIYTDNKLYFVVPNEYTTFSTALQYLVENSATFVFPLATQTDFVFTGQEINSLYGDNTIWNDAGDSSVTYRRDIELALSSGAPLMMMASRPPVTNEENIIEEPVIEDEPQMEGDGE